MPPARNPTSMAMRGDRWLTFDCFGTLVSWQRGFPKILQRVAGERAEELANAYHHFEASLEAGEYRSYKQILRDALVSGAQSIGFPLKPQDENVLAEHWDEQPVFGEVGPALAEVTAAGWKVAALTNCDNDLFERTKRTLPFSFDAQVTAEDVRSYKPAHGHFRRFRDLVQDPEVWIHVACSYFHDIAPARELGIPRIWIDRDKTGEEPSAASHVQPDLNGLVQSVEGLS